MITLPGAALDWAGGHKRALLVVGLLVVGLLAAAFGAGWWWRGAPPTPAVHVVQDDHKASDARSASDVTDAKGAERITITDYDEHAGGAWPAPVERAIAEHMPTDFCRPVTVPGEDRIIRQTVIERAPETVTTHATTEQHAEEDHHLQLTLTPPAPRPGWELQVGLEGGLQLSSARVAVRRRLMGDLWVEVSAEPLQRQLGAALAWGF